MLTYKPLTNNAVIRKYRPPKKIQRQRLVLRSWMAGNLALVRYWAVRTNLAVGG